MAATLQLQCALEHLRSVWCWKRKHYKYRVADIAFSILLEVARKPAGITHKSLFHELPCSQPTATKWLKRMEADGWIEIVENVKDRRVSHIKLARAGQDYLIEYWRAQRKRAGLHKK